MQEIHIDQCPYCHSTNIGVGYQLGNGQVFADIYAYSSTRDCSDIEHILCKECGSILRSRVVKTEMFHPYSTIRQEELKEYLESHGILLCNANDELPSLCGLGYSMENIIGLIVLHQVFYCKAYKKRSTYLSVRAYQLLARCKTRKELYPEAAAIYHELKKYDYVDKDELKHNIDMDKKTYDKAFDFLLENLYITAYAGKRINSNWYSYLYCSAERWNKEVNGLHYNGNAEEALRKLVDQGMSEVQFSSLCR